MDEDAPFTASPHALPNPDVDDSLVESFGGQAGAPVDPHAQPGSCYAQYEAALGPDSIPDDNPFYPFVSQLDWEVACWAKTRGLGSTAFTDLLKIPEVIGRLGLSYHSSRDLNDTLRSSLPGRPSFSRSTIEVVGQTYELYLRDAMECVKALYSSPEFAAELVFAPVKHFASINGERIRMYSDMHTGKWWWQIQPKLERRKPGATIVPLIVSSDKTQLTQFRNRSAYPVYLTLGNIPKETHRKPSRQAQLLLGYFPVTSMEHIKNDEVRRRALASLFHECMRLALAPVKDAGRNGIELASGDGVLRRCHPIFAAFVGDYPEQVLVTLSKTGQCPKGSIDPTKLGSYDTDCELRSVAAAVDALQTLELTNDPLAYVQACHAAGLKPVDAFWKDLPYSNVYLAITPDILHQLYQGMVKHVVSWLKIAYGKRAIDTRFQSLPPNHHLRLFSKGISKLSRVSGSEHEDICRSLLGVIADLPLPDGQSPAHIIRTVRALLDFVYLAQYPVHTTLSLHQLDDSLAAFHANKQVFIDLGVREHFNLPKLHSLRHYVHSIKMLGSADNFNTSYSERLHIDLAKSAYHASNRKDEYPQMTRWLLQREQIHAHAAYIAWRLQGCPEAMDIPPPLPPRQLKLRCRIACYPNEKSVSFARAAERFSAGDFERILKEYIIHASHPEFTSAEISALVSSWVLPFCSVSVFYHLKFWHPDALGHDRAPEILDSIHARPVYTDTQGRAVGGRFDTALINEDGEGGQSGVTGYRIGQIRMIFALSKNAEHASFLQGRAPSSHFAYVEWFSRFPPNPDQTHRMFKIHRSTIQGERVASIIPIQDIRRSVHLFPRFGRTKDPSWTSKNVLELCKEFFVNCFSDRQCYITVR
ncbi:hypothetical protein K488DRAFT_60342 [Vararia minispora EC-137]|uniref:Uncharacterized protein n=1 Tax=Vararia minispora EC-137 TaxID=1314806 RepID=A0ACB8Q835_9AGAM|nr:hypothetical protein K488DRAFT_60342 [Vararia minispora EC-137]